MSVSEAQRFELHRALQNLLGDDVSHTLMEHLPPSGWGDLARMRDMIEMEKRIDARLESLTERIDARFAVVEGQIKGLNSRINAVIGFGTALMLAMLAIQTQLLISVANL